MANNQFRVPTLDSSGKIPATYLPSDLQSFDWLFPDALTARVGQARAIIPNNGRNASLSRVTATLALFSTGDTGLSIQVAIKVNGLLAAQFELKTSSAIIDQDITPDQVLYAGDILTVDILSVATDGGSYLVPSDLTVQAWWRWV